MTLTEISTEAELMTEYYRDVFINELRANLVFDESLGLMGQHPRGQGNMVHWLSLADFSAAGALTEGTDPTETTLSAGDQTATLDQYGQTVKISDILQDVWFPQSYTEVMERLARVAALEIDTVIRDTCFTGGGSAQYAGTAIARNSIATDGSFDMDVAEVREAIHSLEANKAQPYPDGYYRGIIHQDVKYDLNPFGSLYRKIVKKLLKLREYLTKTFAETIRSETQKWGRSETIIGAPVFTG